MEKLSLPRGKSSRQDVRWLLTPAVLESLESRVLMSVTSMVARDATGAISGIVFHDVNGNGVQDAGEAGLKDVNVYADADGNGVFSAGDPNAATDANGAYTLSGLTPGSTSVGEVPPSGYFQNTPANNAEATVNVVAGQTVANTNFGLRVIGATASITGNVFNDANGDGAKNNGEKGQGGVVVYLDVNNVGFFQKGDPTRQTDPNGNYAFSGLTAGSYTVGETLPVGQSQTVPAGGGNLSVALANNQAVVGQNFGITGVPTAPAGTIAGVVFNDTNQNGVQDAGESGISGVTVYVDPTNAGKFVSGDPTDTTDPNGNYAIPGQSNATHLVRVVLPDEYVQTFPTSNGANRITLTAGNGAAGEDFGLLFTPPVTSISGTVFNDANGNASQDSGEAGIAGTTVYIDVNSTGSFVDGDPTTTTDSAGGYTFTGLAAGTYTIGEITPAGDTQTSPAGGAGISVTVTTGQTFTGADFGLNVPAAPAASISGTVFNDANHNGVKDPGEAGVAGVRVYMDPNYNHNWNPTFEQGVLTDSSGNYIFPNPPADPEILRIILPTGAQQTLPASGAGIYVGKNTGKTLTNENFGVYTPVVGATGVITGSVFNDLNGDHAQAGNEPNLPNATVYLDSNNNGKFDTGEPTAVTTSSGTFTFSSVAAGTYTVLVSPSAGYRQTFPVAGGTKVTVAAGKTVSAGKFGVTNTAYVGGTLFNDINGNGAQNTGEGELSGWKIYLDLNKDGKFESNEPTAVSTTTSTGFWYFRAVTAGTYTIRAVPPTGYSITKVYTITLSSGAMVTNGLIGAKKG